MKFVWSTGDNPYIIYTNFQVTSPWIYETTPTQSCLKEQVLVEYARAQVLLLEFSKWRYAAARLPNYWLDATPFCVGKSVVCVLTIWLHLLVCAVVSSVYILACQFSLDLQLHFF